MLLPKPVVVISPLLALIEDGDTIQIDAVSFFTGSIDNVSVKEVIAANGDFTFSRGTNLSATRISASQLIEKGRENIMLRSNEFDNASWVKTNTTLTSGQTGYDGSSNAWLLSKSAANGHIRPTVCPDSQLSFPSETHTYRVRQ